MIKPRKITTIKNKKAPSRVQRPTGKRKDWSRQPGWIPQRVTTGEKAIDATRLSREVPEEFREPVPEEMAPVPPNIVNWSEPEDRGEDLASERDPFMQQPELDTEIPPELVQERAYLLYEQRGGHPGDDLADWFEAERQIRREMKPRAKGRKEK